MYAKRIVTQKYDLKIFANDWVIHTYILKLNDKKTSLEGANREY